MQAAGAMKTAIQKLLMGQFQRTEKKLSGYSGFLVGSWTYTLSRYKKVGRTKMKLS